jgi:hypothetical protein
MGPGTRSLRAAAAGAAAAGAAAAGKNGHPLGQNGNPPPPTCGSPVPNPSELHMYRSWHISCLYYVPIGAEGKILAYGIWNCKICINLLRKVAIVCIHTAHRRPLKRMTGASNMNGASTPTQVTFPRDGLVRTDATATTQILTTPNESSSNSCKATVTTTTLPFGNLQPGTVSTIDIRQWP